ncbi:MAG: HEAT repeat domain-containing protein [Pirellulaceae bacterium]
MSTPSRHAWVTDLRDSPVEQRRAAAQRLAEMDPVPAESTLALVDAVSDADEEVRQWSSDALEKLAAPEVQAVSDLAQRLEHGPPDVAYWSATLLGRLQGASERAVPALARAIEHHGTLAVRERAAWALGQIGPAAQTVRDVLQRAADGNSPRLARLARAALAQMPDSP